MAASNSIPSLFGRITAVSGEHRHLATTTQQVRVLGRELEVTERVDPRLGPLLIQLLSDLTDHFAAEETEGYFGLFAGERPALLPQIAQLRAEHTSMLDALHRIIGAIREQESGHTIARSIGELLDQLQAHERAESTMVQQFLAPSEP